MFTRFKHTTNVLFVDTISSVIGEYKKGEKVDIVLSPKVYWVKKMSLPVKSVREVKKLLPSIFEDSLPDGNYSYTAYKDKDEYMLFAYEDKKILDLISQKGIAHADIASVHFAQSEFEAVENGLEINEEESIYLKDGLLLVVPTIWLENRYPLEINNIKLSKHTIRLQQFGHIVDKKSLYTVGAVFIALIVILIVEIFVASSKQDRVLESKDALFSKYDLQATMFQNRSTHQKYSTIHQRQTKLREMIALCLDLHLQSSQKIKLIEYKNKVLYVVIDGVTKQNHEKLLAQLDAKNIVYKSALKNSSLKIEVSL